VSFYYGSKEIRRDRVGSSLRAASTEAANGSAMLGRMAARLGREVTWDELLSHGEKYSMNMDMRQFS
jgi:ABC-type uncharacterized transport system fused permease/ATPase subunit